MRLLPFVMTLGFAGAAEAKQWRYVGVHPVSAGAYCAIEVPHVHKRAPYRAKVLFRVHDGAYYFVGDPVVEVDYAGPRHAYHGHHPIQIGIGSTHYCSIDGPHHHAFAPVVMAGFEIRGGTYWYVDPLPRHDVEVYVDAPRPRASVAVHLPAPHVPRPHLVPVVPVPSLHVAPVVEHRHSVVVEHRHGKKKGHGRHRGHRR
jgi:hypothetical protein